VTPEPPTSAPATLTPTETTAPVRTATPAPPTNTPQATASPAFTASAAPVTITPSLTITFTITPTPSETLTPTADVGGFSALVDLAGRVTIPPPDVRYGPGTATALWAIGDQLAATARANATATPPVDPAQTGVFAIVPGATLPVSGLGTLPPALGGGAPCNGTPGGALASLLTGDPALAAQLGCATGSTAMVSGAVQPFERGLMIYRASSVPGAPGAIEALSNDGRFTRSADTWVSGVDPDSGGLTPPPGLVEPIRGFGKVWRSDGALAARLGWALAGEQGVTLTVQPFERGVAIYVPSLSQIIVLSDDAGAAAGSWRQVSGSF
jgi:hypothetical protein